MGESPAGAAKSEVARIREQIEREYQACLLALNAPAMTVPHAFIHQRWENIAGYQAQLVDMVGANAATLITAQALDSAAVEGETPTDKIRQTLDEMKNLKQKATTSYQAVQTLCTSSPSQTAVFKSYLKDLVGIQMQFSALVGPTEAQNLMFEAMEGLESSLLKDLELRNVTRD